MLSVEVSPYSYVRMVPHESGVLMERVINVPAHTRKRPVRRRAENQPELEGFRLIDGQMSIYDVPGV